METPIFVARVFGIFYLVLAVSFMYNRQLYQKLFEDYSKSTSLVFFSGIFALIIGIAIVLLHNVWAANWTIIITIIGWAALIKGIWLIVFPNTVPGFMQAYKKNKYLLKLQSVAVLVFGIVLTFFGFFAK